jgi:type II secretory pathway component PulM
MELLLGAAIVLLLVLVPIFVGWPVFRRERGTGEEVDRADAELAELEARKDAKYREIRDAEADRAAGKLSEEDFQRLDRELRREAIEILKRIDRLRERAGPSV